MHRIARARSERERREHLWFLDSIDRISRAMQGANDVEQMMMDVLDAALEIFDCERAWLFYPCDPEAPSCRVAMERTRPTFPGARAPDTELAVDAEDADVFRTALASAEALLFGTAHELRVPAQVRDRFGVQSQIAIAIRPKADQPYLFGLHQCSRQRRWTKLEERLFHEIGRRLEDALTSLLMLRSLRESERKLKEVQRLAHVGHWDHDLAHGLSSWSEETFRIFGLTKRKYIDFADFQERIHPEDRRLVMDTAAKALADGARFGVEYRVVRPNGDVRFVHSLAEVERHGTDRARIFGIIQDITDQRRARDELSEAKRQFSVLAESSLAGVYLIQDGRFQYVNPAMARMFGYAADEIAGHLSPADLVSPADRSLVAENIRRRLDGEIEEIRYQFHGLRRDGSVFPVEVHGRGLQHGGKSSVIGTLIDNTERQRAEDELRRNKTRLEEAQRIAHVGWWERNFTTNQVSLSDEVCRIFGVDSVDLPEWHERWLRLIHPDDRAMASEAAAAALRGGRRYDVEYRVIRPDGSVRTVHSEGDVIRDVSGKPLRQFGVLQDITELRLAERELRASEARFRTFVDHATDSFFLLDDQLTVLDVNRQACDDLGYTREELIGMTPRAFDVGLDEASILRLRQRVKAGETLTFETSHRRKDGTTFPVEIRVTQFEQGGRHLCLVRDITERKRAEQRMIAHHTVTSILAEARTVEEATPKILRALCESLGWDVGALWRLDREVGVLRCAELWCASPGESRHFLTTTRDSAFRAGIGLPGQVWASRKPACIPLVKHDPLFMRADAAIRDGLRSAMAFPILLGPEVLGVADFASQQLIQPEQELLDVVATIGSQIGQFMERKRAENALQLAQAELAHVARVTTMGELTASIAHEISQPVAATVTNAEAALYWLNADPPNLNEARQVLNCITRDGNRAGDIISRIRDLVKKTPPRKDVFDVNEAVHEVVEVIRGTAAKNAVSMTTALESGLPPVLGDKVQVQQVVLNLAVNAVEAMAQVDRGARRLQIRTSTAEAGILVAVADSGPGLTPDISDRVFDTFYTTKAGGLGLGLSICSSIVEAHAGKLSVTANLPSGAVFQFTLPVRA